jgi:hypothetical protein
MALDEDSTDDGGATKMSGWGRFTGSISHFMLKPRAGESSDEESPKQPESEPTTVPEIEAAIKRANDKERAIGLIGAPVAAAIALLVVSTLISHDPSALYANGQVDPKHVSTNLYEELGAVTLALSLLMLAAAWFRKRLLLGITMALYGLSIFNLHYWGFGIPFILGGAWYLVRAYRLSEKLKAAKAGDPIGGTGGRGTTSRSQPSKRFTPRAAPVRRTSKSKPGKELGAG